jgi:nicotinamidase/pyrazinamidase
MPEHKVSRRKLVATAGGASLASFIPKAHAQGKIKPGAEAALVVVDVQNCFLPGGSLAVAKGDEIIPVINRIAKAFQNVVLTQDWHTPGHISFASSHAGKKPFESIDVPYGKQILWPDHCVQGTEGAAIHKDNIETVYVVGLATDFCVGWTAMDARKLGLAAYVIEDACRGIDTQGSLAAAWKAMEEAGVKRIQSGDLAM